MSSFILVVNDGELFVPGDTNGASIMLIIHTMNHLTNILSTIVLSWDIRSQWTFKITTPDRFMLFISLSEKNYLICSIVFCCYRRSLPPWCPLTDVKEITSLSKLKTFLKANSTEITPPCYALNTCILYQLCFKQHGFLKGDLIGYTHANFRHATTFGCRNIAFQIWWLPYNPHESKWPKTFCGRCIYHWR